MNNHRQKLDFLFWCLAAAILALSMPACDGKSAETAQTGEKRMHPLPEPRRHGEISVEAAIHARRSVRAYRDRSLNIDEISQLLWAAQGITDARRQFRTAPSAGATFPLEVYAVSPEGLSRYHPLGHQLEQLNDTDLRAALSDAALGQSCVRTAPLTLVFSAVMERTTRRYSERGQMYVHMEAGHAAQNVHLQAVALGLGSVPVGAFDEARIARILGIPDREVVLYLISIGEPASDP